MGRDLRIAGHGVRASVVKPGFSGRGVRERDSRHAALGGVRKRAFDVVMAGIALILLMPIMLVTAVLIRLSMMGESIIVAECLIGLGGRAFARYKFRTAGGLRWAEILSEALSRSSLDKVPQLFNVVRGDMSLAGPRPRIAHEMHDFAQVPECLLARPGLIGMWQAYGQKGGNYRSEIALDRYYVRHWSMRLDFALLINALLAAHHEDRIT